MKTIEAIQDLPAEVKAQLEQALDCPAKGIRDREAAKKSSERMDRLREENRQLFGEQISAAEIIRQLRESR